VIYPDGRAAFKPNGEAWSITDKNGSTKNADCLTDWDPAMTEPDSKREESTGNPGEGFADDFIVIEDKKEGITVVEHIDGTSISTLPGKSFVLQCTSGVSVKFQANGDQIIKIGSDFEIARTFQNNKTKQILIRTVGSSDSGKI
jgi:hypothetical protein